MCRSTRFYLVAMALNAAGITLHILGMRAEKREQNQPWAEAAKDASDDSGVPGE